MWTRAGFGQQRSNTRARDNQHGTVGGRGTSLLLARKYCSVANNFINLDTV
jgi:hypothetical protein